MFQVKILTLKALGVVCTTVTDFPFGSDGSSRSDGVQRGTFLLCNVVVGVGVAGSSPWSRVRTVWPPNQLFFSQEQ